MRKMNNCDHEARLGKLTASKIADATAKIKTGEAASRITYRAQLVAERLTRMPQGVDLYNNKAVQWGNDTEPFARSAFEAETGLLVAECQFVDHADIANAGCSPDGLVGADAVVEIKCPNTATHIEYLKANSVPSTYRKQILWQLACTKRTKAYFVSFDPRLDAGNQLLVVPFIPTAKEIEELEAEAKIFLAEVDADEKWLRERTKQPMAQQQVIATVELGIIAPGHYQDAQDVLNKLTKKLVDKVATVDIEERRRAVQLAEAEAELKNKRMPESVRRLNPHTTFTKEHPQE
jgi:putative phage-type endonuclease